MKEDNQRNYSHTLPLQLSELPSFAGKGQEDPLALKRVFGTGLHYLYIGSINAHDTKAYHPEQADDEIDHWYPPCIIRILRKVLIFELKIMISILLQCI